MRTLRSYNSTAQAIGDIAVLESQGIASQFKGDLHGDAHHIVAGIVELQVSESDFTNAAALLATADRERFEEHVSPDQRKKTVGRYVKVAAAAFLVTIVFLVWKSPTFASSPSGFASLAFVAAGFAAAIGFVAALLDL